MQDAAPPESVSPAPVRGSRRSLRSSLSDPGWPFVLAGLVILAAWALIPAAADRDELREQLRFLEERRAVAAAQTAEHRRTIEHLARAVAAPPDEAGRLEPADQETLRRLSLALLRRMPAGQSEMVVDGQVPPPLVERLVPWDDAATEATSGDRPTSPGAAGPAERPSRLERLVSGPGRLWVAGVAVFSVFAGLLLGPSAAPGESGRWAGRPTVRDRRRRHRPVRAEAAAHVDATHRSSAAHGNRPDLMIESRSAPATGGPSRYTLAPPSPGAVEAPLQHGLADSAAQAESDVIVRVKSMEQAMKGAVLELNEATMDEMLLAASGGPGSSIGAVAPFVPVAAEDEDEDEDFEYFDDDEEDSEEEEDEDDGFWYDDDDEESDEESDDEEESEDDEDEDDEDEEDSDEDDEEESEDEYGYSEDEEDEEYDYDEEESDEDEDEDDEED